MVLSWNPLTAFANSDVYFRVAGKPFELGVGKPLHPFAHMTNVREEDNRVAAPKLLAEVGPEASRNFASQTWPQMLDIVRAVVLASWQSVMVKEEPQGSAFELFGLDFALDEEMQPWLLEVNASPDLLQSCEIARIKKLGREGMESMLAIALAHQDGTLRIPRHSELQKRLAHAADLNAKRLFIEGDLDCEKSHGRAKCYGRAVASIPPCLINGLNLGGGCKKWRLILREPMQPVGGIQTKSSISRHGLSVEKYSDTEDNKALHMYR
eukprot:gnl/MRDRNA2_/MRDRNA2_203208_c0_seq1.p1 gnl/MRDRNA2_/MRDRNA2_203208_c0~~gnl/MRDRNA2_/MRDRNA2_203208_c0_seq1.p1  ORF type:complete len:267 (+),score=44.58 gnl/MRDRNA2_/MRDRNA2_203208_c0_seq1:256-1056(+)